MIKVKNSKAINNLSKKSLKANRTRNLVAILAIALTATLFTALFTIGGSMMASIQRATMEQVGTSSHAGFKFLTQEQYDKVAADPKVKDISYNILIGTAENPELSKVYTEIRYAEEKDAEWSFCKPSTGTLPKEKYDIATSAAVLDALGVAHELGQTVPLQFTVHGVQITQNFVLCGFWEGSIAMGANEAYVSREYCDEVAPVITVPLYESESSDFAGTINPSLWFSTSWDIDGQVEALKERCGFDKRVNEGVNWAYGMSVVDASTVILVCGVLLLILLSGYLIIYNVFQISVSRDIRFYGLLKTIGTTGRQIKALVRRQALILSIAGIPLGLIAGYLIGRVIMPAVIKSTTIADSFVITASPVVFVGAAIFALLTVFISCIRPCRLAAKVSPVEAVRWTGISRSGGGKRRRMRRKTQNVTPFNMAVASLKREKKKVAVVLLSLTLSLVLLNGTYTVVKGFDMEKYVANSAVTDFSMTDATLRNNSSERNLEGISASVISDIKALPGMESVGAIYVANTIHTLSEQALTRAKEIVERNRDVLPSPYADTNIQYLEEDGQMMDMIYGVDEALWDKLEIYEGQEFDREKFASGEYVLATSFWNTGGDPYYEPGDEVTLDFENGNTKTYKVLALGNIPYALSQQFGFYLDIYFTLPASEYKAQMGETSAMSVGFNVDDAHLEDTEKWCAEYTENVETGLTYTSWETMAQQFRSEQTMFAVVGGALSVILGLIGILNFINAMVTSVSARRRELAMLQSIGMTGRQMRRMLIDEGLFYGLGTIILTVTVGSAVCYAGVKLITDQMWFFTWHFSLLPVLICVPFTVLIAVLVPCVCCNFISRHTIVERLRETE